MLAAVLHGPGDLRVEEVPVPVAGTGQVAISVACNGLCGSDLKLFETGLRALTEPHPITGHCGPQILGHELSGPISAMGDGVTGLAVGDRVCVQPVYHCGNCPPCQQGWTHLCQIITFHGVIAAGGGLSECTVVPASMVHRLPDGLSLEQGALVEPLAVSHHAVDRSKVEPGDLAAVIGAGPIGIGVVLGLRARGVDAVVVSEPSPARRAVIDALGAQAVDPSELAATLGRRTVRGGADVAFDCAGRADTFGVTVAAVRARGRVVVVAGSAAYPLQTTAHLLMHTEIDITGSVAFERADFSAVMAGMVAGAYPTDAWVEHIPLAQIVEEGIRPLLAGRKSKVLVDLPGLV